MHIFLIATILVLFLLVFLPLWVNFITKNQKKSNYWQPRLSNRVRVIVLLSAISLHGMAGVYIEKHGVENWVFTFLMFIFGLYLMDCYLANRVMVIPYGRIEPEKHIYLRRFLFVFSLAMVVVWSVV